MSDMPSVAKSARIGMISSNERTVVQRAGMRPSLVLSDMPDLFPATSATQPSFARHLSSPPSVELFQLFHLFSPAEI